MTDFINSKAVLFSGTKNRVFDKEFGFYSEEYFREMLVRERKRTERSQKPIVLCMIDIRHLRAALSSKDIARKISLLMASSTRNIDIKGWYEHNRCIGIIYIEINKSGIESVVNKLRANLVALFGARIAGYVRVSMARFPEDDERPLMQNQVADIRFYPSVDKIAHAKGVSLAFKRLLDIVGSVFLLMLFSPAFILITVLIKCTSRGPVFFTQKRVGRGGKSFTFLKFRSMHVNNDATVHREFVKSFIKSTNVSGSPVYKLTNDPRITTVGKFLRKTSLDELPQFINVLAGPMSLVGPRPAIPYEVEEYNAWHRCRVLEVKPGITGFWQVKGRSRTTFDAMVRMDIQYIRKWSLVWDIKLLFQTPFALFKGAY
jgi:lipopolysaccharide/colanic/teichoic acid biosynthesis glycosyltransferase